MTIALIALLAVALIGFLVVLDRKDQRSHAHALERDAAHRLEVAGLVERLTAQAGAHREEVGTLLQRIQAPDVAVVQHQQAVAGPPQAVWPLTDEESARQQSKVLLSTIRELEEAEELTGG